MTPREHLKAASCRGKKGKRIKRDPVDGEANVNPNRARKMIRGTSQNVLLDQTERTRASPFS